MAWTAPMTFIPNTVLTAAQLNTHVRDNLLELAPAKATGGNNSGYFVVERPHLLGRRIITSNAISRRRATNSSAWTDLDYVTSGTTAGSTVGPTVRCLTGTSALVMMSTLAWKANGSPHGDTCMVAVEIFGATTRAPEERYAFKSSCYEDSKVCGSFIYRCDDLTPGMNTFRMKYKVNGGSRGYFTNSRIVIMPL